jgi:hypothetical protein
MISHVLQQLFSCEKIQEKATIIKNKSYFAMNIVVVFLMCKPNKWTEMRLKEAEMKFDEMLQKKRDDII